MQKVSREEWGARAPRNVPSGINTQTGTDHWEGTSLGVFAHESCATKVRAIQAFHMDSRGWNDIAYNFVVCPHGFIHVGRDHGIRSAANGTNEGNNQSEATCYLGGPGDQFTEAGKSALKEINAEISSTIYPHKHWFNTQCPGNEIVDWLDAGQPTTDVVVPTLPPPVSVNNDQEARQNFPGFPLPDGHWFGKPDKSSRNHSGYYNPRDRTWISAIQHALNVVYGSGLKEDGFYGQKTSDEVEKFQAITGITTDGLAGLETWNTLAWVWNSHG